MKRTWLKLMVLLLCVSMTLTLIPAALAAAGDEVRAAKKIISVVYDDSGSMYGDSWVYANYAMQALTALLNAQDELYITYMSEPWMSRRVDLADIGKAVSDIRTWANSGGTPGESLETAKKKLDGISESDTSAQFWLIVLTDGQINMSGTIQSKLNSFKGAKMSNGSPLNVVYLAMGPGAVAAGADTRNGLYTYKADSNKEIFQAMSGIANLVSSRVDADKVQQVDDKTISFHSELPLYSISVLAQQSTASVVDAKSQEETLNIDRNIALDAWEPFGVTQTKLYGNAAVINLVDSAGASRVIQAGTYTITFSEPVSVSDLLVQYEPAIGLKMIIDQDGIELSDTSALVPGSKVNVELIPVIPGTDQRISDSSLPKGISWKVEYIVDGNLEDSGTGQKLPGIVLKPGDNTIRGTMQIPGFAPSVYDLYFPVAEIIYHFGIEVDQPSPLSYYRNSMGSSVEGGSITFRLTNEGVALTKEEQKTIGVRLETASVSCDNSAVTGFFNRFGKVLGSCDLKQNDDGSYTLVPRSVIPFTAFLTMAGDYTVTVCVDREPGITQTGTFTLVARAEDWIDVGIVIAGLLLLIYLIYILFIKYKFSGKTVCYRTYKLLSDGSGAELVSSADTLYLNPLKNILSLKRGSETKFHGLILQAGPDGTVIVTGKSISKEVDYYTMTSMDPTISLGAIAASLQTTRRIVGRRTEHTATDRRLSATRPVYFRTNEEDRTIWCLHLLQ